MASLGHKAAYQSPSARSKKEISVQKRREGLEREVSTLHKMLDHEEKVHEVLEYMLRRPDGSALNIPNFLPPKMKELLAELVMVEDEIARLESEVSRLQRSLGREEEPPKDPISQKWHDEDEPPKDPISQKWHDDQSVKNPDYEFSAPLNPNPTFKGLNERVPFETKALYFISKAIKGEYKFDGFSSIETKENSKRTTTQKENHGPEEIRIQDKASRKHGILMQKPASSPQRPPRHSMSKPSAPEPEISFDFPPRSTLESSPLRESSTGKVQPNKLSESIMKCLIFIFLRLIRASRMMELEKSGTISRSTHLSLSSRSFRIETGVNSKTNLPLQGELRQQDPYGIFDVEDSISRDIGPYKNLVKFTSNSLDPKCISSSNSIPLLQKLRDLMSSLQNVDLKFLSHQQKLAFWINIYNACVMHGFLQYGVPSNTEKLHALMNKAALNVGGNKINALAIEHFILRQPSASPKLKDVHWKGEEEDKEFIIRNIYGLESLEPNITFALCCGTRSSPAVKIYSANNVISELEKSKLEYLQASVVVTSTKRLLFPELLFQNMLDFGSDAESLVEWVCHQLPTSWSLRKAMVDCFKGHSAGKTPNSIDKMPYDFEFQYLLPI